MKKIIFIIVILLIIISGGIMVIVSRSKKQPPLISDQKIIMKLSSPAFENNQYIPSDYTCDGKNISPPLIISDASPVAKSLVLIVDDPDAPRGDWVHWTIWNVKPDTREIAENSVPEGAIEGMTDFGRPGYGGPCPPRVDERQRVEAGPPSGVHRYQFKLYALDVVLDLSSTSAKQDIE
ncbi:MAG: YbhB/YbcL family Raf kinase inhibitor-like protein, partial [Candidatus Moranbacteria bacterium]|nr:YbhB/YbcL family Raf kinase inhibitor-like protein [Candidatus Moranbacteria bacterium]